VTLTRLSLTDFRSYRDTLMTPGPQINILTGENGAGKTNILEAVSLLAPGRGLRGAALADMACKTGAGGFGVAGHIGETALGTGTLANAPERRLVRINGATASAASLGEWVSILWLTPAMDRLFVDSASERRRFMDRLTFALDPLHAGHLNRYDAAMRQRNRLLAEEQPADPDWLSALEVQMMEHGEKIAAARQHLVDTLGAHLETQSEGPFARAGLARDGWRARGDFAAHLLTNRGRDAAARRTLIGPHREDFLVTHLGKNQPAAQSSTGEQKALLLGILLAHADLLSERLSRRPLLLLDEVAAHLDPLRREALFDRLYSGGGQVWMTGTEPALFNDVPGSAARFTVCGGLVRPCFTQIEAT
jgi:DNA replication and repair protein RecF